MRIKEVNKSDVLRLIVDGKKVFRINIENLSVADLGDKTINVIKRDLEKNDYVYFILEKEKAKIHYPNPYHGDTPFSVYLGTVPIEEKRKCVKKFCDSIIRCQDCPLNSFIDECYEGASDEIIERHYQIIKEYENEV